MLDLHITPQQLVSRLEKIESSSKSEKEKICEAQVQKDLYLALHLREHGLPVPMSDLSNKLSNALEDVADGRSNELLVPKIGRPKSAKSTSQMFIDGQVLLALKVLTEQLPHFLIPYSEDTFSQDDAMRFLKNHAGSLHILSSRHYRTLFSEVMSLNQFTHILAETDFKTAFNRARNKSPYSLAYWIMPVYARELGLHLKKDRTVLAREILRITENDYKNLS